jgi:uncharacterized repeat protein (TIGR03847 family)
MPTSAEHDLGPIDTLETEAIGEPGNRTFRVRVLAGDQCASMWLEKEQVGALATALQQVLGQNRKRNELRRPEPPALVEFPEYPTYDFHVSRLALAYDEGADVLAIYVTNSEAEDQERPMIRATFTREQARRFSAQAESTIAAGRPLCPLCKAPLDFSQHLCPPANGHSDDALSWLGVPDL